MSRQWRGHEKIDTLSQRILRKIGAGLAMAVALLAVSPTRAQSPDPCWTPVELPTEALVELVPLGKELIPELNFQSATETNLQSLDRKTLTSADVGETVRLAVSAGQTTVRRGPLLMVHNGVAYVIPGPLDVPLVAQAGTRLRLSIPIEAGKLPADVPATAIVDSQEPLRAKLATSVRLSPATPDRETAWLDAGALPITRGGRMLSVDLYAPTKSAAELKVERFQACFGDISPSIVVVTSARDGVATLSVPVPNQVFSGYAFWNNVSLKVLGTTDGMLSTPVEIRIGNPYVAAVISVLIATIILFLLTHLTERWSGTKPAAAWSLQRLFVGQDGEPSLSLLQMYMWTGLVVTGMLYVFLMSGDLLNISEQVLVLLGLAGLSSVSSRFVGAHTVGTTPGTGHGFWGMFLVGGKPDLLRLQLFIFTLAIWVYVAIRVFYEHSFPELDANVLLLMGISNGLYVGAKWAAGGTVT
jgi:hypothetical protein